MLKNRNIAVCIVLSFITCGIYGIYWIICMVNDVNVVSDRQNDTSGGVVFLLSLITCGIFFWVWYYNAGAKIEYAQQKRGLPSTNNGVLYLVLGIFGLGIVNYCLIQIELNKMSEMPA